MLGFGESMLGFAASLVLPSLVGVGLAIAVPRSRAKLIAGFGIGVFLVYFSDTFADSAYLDLNAGASWSAYQLSLIVLMAAGLLLTFYGGRDLFEGQSRSSFVIPVVAALALGLHAFGEGTGFGSVAASTPSSSFLSAFGGSQEAISFVLHKGLESVVVGACYACFRRGDEKGRELARDASILTAAFVLPGILGAATGYALSYDATFAFAAAVGSSVFVLALLWSQVFSGASEKARPLWIGLSIIAGFLLIYAASALHS